MTSMYGDGPSIKVESAQSAMNGQDPRIKPDPDSLAPSPGPHSDDEDAGDLVFTGAQQGLYLAKVPNFLWESWEKMDDDQEIQIGTLRVEGGLGDIKRMSLHLSQEAAAIHELPSEYKMVVADRNVDNTFIFSEKDLPGYRKFSHGRAPPRFKDRKRVEKGGRPEKHFRTFIPKQTNLVGQVQTEINCLPVENGDFQQYIAREKKRREVQKPKIARWDEAANNGNVIIPGDINTALRYSGFISKPQAARKNKEKAARMPQNELMDRIFQCFRAFKYWSLASLKQDLVQPEAYLKETLDKFAELIRSGPMNGKYQLKTETEARYADPRAFDNVKAEAAPEADPDAPDITDDDDEEEMEDVLP